MKTLHLHRRTDKPSATTTTTAITKETGANAAKTKATVAGEVTAADVTESKAMMAAIEKKVKKEMKSQHKKQSSAPCAQSSKEIEPPRFHRDMRLICDVFRISEQSRYALRTFDAATLEDFSLMTDEDYTDLIVTRARLGEPIPPLQQRKLRVLLSWAQSIKTTVDDNNLVVTQTASSASCNSPNNKSQSIEMNESKEEYHNTTDKGWRKQRGKYIPSDWEDKFYADLPRLRKELQLLGEKGSSSNWATNFLSLRWIFCFDG